MRIEIRATNVPLTETARDAIERRLLLGLGRFANRLGRVTVRLTDVNGPRGGEDKQCRVSVEVLPRSELVVLEEVGADMLGAMTRAAARVAAAVTRRLDRAVSVRRRRSSAGLAQGEREE